MLEGMIWFHRLLQTGKFICSSMYPHTKSSTISGLISALKEKEYIFQDINSINSYIDNMLTIQNGQKINLPIPLRSFLSQLQDKEFTTFGNFKMASNFSDQHLSELFAADLERIQQEELTIFFFSSR
jgi:hypothetical protein